MDRHLPVYMNEDEYQTVKSKAKEAGLTMSRYLVLKGLGKLKE